jgi:hypothetical protein
MIDQERIGTVVVTSTLAIPRNVIDSSRAVWSVIVWSRLFC